MPALIPVIDFDEPLQKASAIQSDELGRLAFAKPQQGARDRFQGFAIRRC